MSGIFLRGHSPFLGQAQSALSHMSRHVVPSSSSVDEQNELRATSYCQEKRGSSSDHSSHVSEQKQEDHLPPVVSVKPMISKRDRMWGDTENLKKVSGEQ